MNQSIFIIRHDYFDNPTAGKEFVKKLVDENCHSEKLAFIFEPLAEDFFTHVAQSNRDMFEGIVKDFFSHWENSKDTMPLKWYQLDEVSTFHIAFLSPVIYETDEKYCSYIIGCIPLADYEPNLHLYFRLSTYDVEDIFLLIDSKKYIETLEKYITKFNEYVRKVNKSEKATISDK